MATPSKTLLSLTAEQLAKMKRWAVSRPLNTQEQRKFIELVMEGYKLANIRKIMKINKSVIPFTRDVYPEFDLAVKEARKNEALCIETKLLEDAIHGNKEVKLTYVPKMGPDGKNVIDKNGKPVMILLKKEVKKFPANDRVLLEILAARMPEVYGKLAQEGTPVQTTQETKKLLEERLASFKKAKT